MIWLVPSLLGAGIVLLIDFIVRRKKWKENTKTEKIGLILTVLFSFPYIFGSVYGVLLGILGTYSESPVEELINKVIVYGGKAIGPVCLTATIASLVLRKIGRSNVANRSLIIGFAYCMLIIGASYILG